MTRAQGVCSRAVNSAVTIKATENPAISSCTKSTFWNHGNAWPVRFSDTEQNVAQLVNSGVKSQVHVWLPVCGKDFGPGISFQRRLFYAVCTSSACMQSHVSTPACMKKSRALAAIPLFGATKILWHTGRKQELRQIFLIYYSRRMLPTFICML